MSFFVLIQEPGVKPLYVACGDPDACLDVVGHEIESTPVGTRVTMLRDVRGREYMEPLRIWHVRESGARGYKPNKMDSSEVSRVMAQMLADDAKPAQRVSDPAFVPNESKWLVVSDSLVDISLHSTAAEAEEALVSWERKYRGHRARVVRARWEAYDSETGDRIGVYGTKADLASGVREWKREFPGAEHFAALYDPGTLVVGMAPRAPRPEARDSAFVPNNAAAKKRFIAAFKKYSRGVPPDKRSFYPKDDDWRCPGGIFYDAFVVAWPGDGQLILGVCLQGNKASVTKANFGFDRTPKKVVVAWPGIYRASGLKSDYPMDKPKAGKHWSVTSHDFEGVPVDEFYDKLIAPLMDVVS